MLESILVMSAAAAILTVIIVLLRPLLKKNVSASARAFIWCFVLGVSLVPLKFTLPRMLAAPVPTVRDIIEMIMLPAASAPDSGAVFRAPGALP